MNTIFTPNSIAEFKKRIADRKDVLPKRLQDCASFILRKGDEMAFLTVAQAAEESGIAPSAFVRFAQAIGMKGYSDLQQLYRRHASQPRPPYSYRINTLKQRGETKPDLLFLDFCDTSIASLERMMHNMDVELIEKTTELICSAPELHIVGLKRAFSVASYLAYVIGMLGHRVILHSNTGAIDVTRSFRPGETVLFISFDPYTPEVIELAEQARRDDAQIIAITDNALSPLSSLADVSLEVVEEEVGGFRTFSATFCLAAALAVSVGTRMNAQPHKKI